MKQTDKEHSPGILRLKHRRERRALLTMDTPDIAYHCYALRANKADYASRWGYTFIYEPRAYWPEISPVYSKVWYIRELLRRGFDTVVWADADIAFTDFTRDIGDLVDDKHWLAGMRELGKTHKKYICAGLLVFRHDWRSMETLERILQLIEGGDHPEREGIEEKREQRQLNNILHNLNYKGVHACTENEIGSVWEEVKGPPLKRSWQPGDLTIHMSLMPWEYRCGIWLGKYQRHVKR